MSAIVRTRDLRDRVRFFIPNFIDDELGGLKTEHIFLEEVYALVKLASTREIKTKSLNHFNGSSASQRHAIYQVTYHTLKEERSPAKLEWEGKKLKVISEPVYDNPNHLCHVFAVLESALC